MRQLNGRTIERTRTTCPSCRDENHRTAGGYWPTLNVLDGEAFCHHHGDTDLPTLPAVFKPVPEIAVGDTVSGDCRVTRISECPTTRRITWTNGDYQSYSETLDRAGRFMIEPA